MKKLLISALLLAALSARAQAPATPRTEEYCVMHTQGTSKGFAIQVDYGQKMLKATEKEKDTAGNELNFNSAADALNYLNASGWELVTAYNGAASAGIVAYQTVFYVMRRKIQR